MTIAHDASYRGWSQGSTHGATTLFDKFELLKEIGDGSFGSVALARVRGAGSQVARRGTLVAIKTMKKTYESFAPCLELREIIFLRSLPTHQHLVPALDIFLDPLTKKLHIAMEYMDGNLYQLMKTRDHKCFDGNSVKSILYQILSGLDHIHQHGFFHRDIKPENILVSVSSHQDHSGAFKRYSQLVTPPSTPPSYSIKLADFGLARETGSRLPYTTYVSTRWYRAPEVLLRAGEYSTPVDVWAVGAMAVEVATLKPLFPGGNEVDQVWRICEIMGSPGNWVNKYGERVGGGDWKDGVKLAQKLGFSFPKMAPHTLDTILQSPQWTPSLRQFVTWCLAWDPKTRPTCAQAMSHEYFSDAFDPLRPKSASKLIGRKHSSFYDSSNVDSNSTLSSKTSSWFRRSLIARESAPVVPQAQTTQQESSMQVASPQMSPRKHESGIADHKKTEKIRPNPSKRNTWTNGAPNDAAPMPILPSIRPISPLSNAVTAQAHAGAARAQQQTSFEHGQAEPKPPKKLGRQLSQASQGNHYAEDHRIEAERALNGQNGLVSPIGSQKESFFSHLRKRARRLSGRHQLPLSPRVDDLEANVSGGTWAPHSGHDSSGPVEQSKATSSGFMDLDNALRNVRCSLDATSDASNLKPYPSTKSAQRVASTPSLKRHHSLAQAHGGNDAHQPSPAGLHASRSTRRVAQKPTLPPYTYEAPDEQEELLDEALNSAQAAMMHLDRQQYNPPRISQDYSHVNTASRSRPVQVSAEAALPAPYPTPSPSAKRNSVIFGSVDPGAQTAQSSKPIDIQPPKHTHTGTTFPFPTPPDENEWAAAAAASLGLGEQWKR
ncbi:MAG: hypothetical protein Q9159_007302 [Coniocarpon cinnabarinum]